MADEAVRVENVRGGPLALLRAMRPKQWIKNVLLFAGLVFTVNDRWRPMSPEMWTFAADAALAFVIFCLSSSSIYLLNDVLDVEKDRAHPKKRFRPVASGALSARIAVTASLLLMPAGVIGAYALRPAYAAIIGGYLLMQLAYVFVLKHLVLVDVFVIAIGFVMRAAAGAVVIGAEISPWLYTVTLLGALFLGLCKRRNELLLLEGDAAKHRKILDEYTPALLDTLVSITASAAIMAYSLYTFSSPKLPANHMMMLTVPFVIFGMFRYLYLAHRKNEGGSPEEVLFKDRPLLVTILLWVATAALILGLAR
jgi:4-hydroxybenzoate polyprenyltransferase